MAEQWQNSDSARTMTRKFNASVEQLNKLTSLTVGINNEYVRTVCSAFAIDDDGEGDGDASR